MVIQLLFLALLTLALATLAVAETIVLDGRNFWSTSVTVGGQEKTLVLGTRLKISFYDDGRVSTSAGCNSMQGDTYSVDEGGILTIGGMSMTAIGCEEGLHEQDQFLAELLGSQPTVVLEENKLVLSTDAVTIDFLDRKIADPDRPLVGTDWLENGFFSKVFASKWSVDKAGWIKFSADEKCSFFDGCAEGELIYSNAPYDELINFEVAEGRVTCADSLSDNIDAYAADFNKIFDTKSVRYEIIGPHLKLSNENGDGVSFTAGTIVDSFSDSSAGDRNQCLGMRAPFSVMMAALLFTLAKYQ